MKPACVALLTDFGRRDPYVGLMEAVLERLCPGLRTLELTHELEPQDVGAAAFWLARCQPWLPTPSLSLAVVDPGVGTLRRALAVRSRLHTYVAPDNGLLTDVLEDLEARAEPFEAICIEPERVAPTSGTLSRTFHGRDLFAPAAGHLAQGQPLDSLGQPLDPATLVRRHFELPLGVTIAVAGKVVRPRVADRFGNILTDAPCDQNNDPGVTINGAAVPWVGTYAEAAPSALCALRGSFDTVELAVNGASAFRLLSS